MAKRPSISSAIWVLTIGLLLIGGMVAYNTFGAKIGGVSIPGSSTGSTTNIVTSSTALSFNAADAQNLGTSVTNTPYIAVGGESIAAYTTGVTTASPGQILDILVANTSNQYHAAFIKNYVVPNSPTASIPVKMNKNASITMSLFNTNNAVMTAGGTGTNQSVAAGGAYNMEVRLDGQDKTNTQDMRCIFESSNTTAMSKVTLSGLGAKYIGMAKPASYTLSSAASAVWVYDIDPIVGATSSRGVVNVQSKTGQTLFISSLKIACYTKEYFIDSQSGKVTYDIEDSQGTLKSIGSVNATYYFYS